MECKVDEHVYKRNRVQHPLANTSLFTLNNIPGRARSGSLPSYALQDTTLYPSNYHKTMSTISREM